MAIYDAAQDRTIFVLDPADWEGGSERVAQTVIERQDLRKLRKRSGKSGKWTVTVYVCIY